MDKALERRLVLGLQWPHLLYRYGQGLDRFGQKTKLGGP